MVAFPQGTVGMIFGRSSPISKGFIVHPETIDEDYQKEITIMAHVEKSMQNEAFDRIAQLLTPITKSLSSSSD